MVTKKVSQKPFLKYSRTIGMTTMRGRGFYFPVDSAMSSDGRIFVLSRSSEIASSPDTIRITVLNEAEEYFGVFGKGGDDPGSFRWPCGIALDNSGNVYVTDEHHHRVSIFRDSGDFISNWGTHGSDEGQLNGPSGIVIDGDDNLLISDAKNHRVQKFSKDGRFIFSFGTFGDKIGEMNLPWGITVGPASEIYVADWGNDRIQKFSKDGEFLCEFGSGDGEFTKPASIVVDSEGYIFVADWGNEAIQILDSDGVFVQKLLGEATDSEWAKEYFDLNRDEGEVRGLSDLQPNIEFFNDDPHEKSSHIEKLFWGPSALFLDSKERLFITETNRHRIQIFERNA